MNDSGPRDVPVYGEPSAVTDDALAALRAALAGARPAAQARLLRQAMEALIDARLRMGEAQERYAALFDRVRH